MVRTLKLVSAILIASGLVILLVIFGPPIKQEIIFQYNKLIGTSYYIYNNQDHDGYLKERGGIIPKSTDFGIIIPKINANVPIFANIDPFNEKEFLPILKEGIAHAKNTSFPGHGSNIFLFASLNLALQPIVSLIIVNQPLVFAQEEPIEQEVVIEDQAEEKEDQEEDGSQNEEEPPSPEEEITPTPTPIPDPTPPPQENNQLIDEGTDDQQDPETTPTPTPVPTPTPTPQEIEKDTEEEEDSNQKNLDISPSPDFEGSAKLNENPPEEEPAEVVGVCLEEGTELTQSVNDDWEINEEEGFAQTLNPVQLGVTYIYPQEEKVTVTFTCLPEDESLRSPLKIQKVKISDLNLPEDYNPYGEYAYDITTDMANGTFEYDVTLPSPENEEVGVSYIENADDEIKTIEKEKINQEKGNIKVEKLNHFTLFFVGVVGATTDDQASSPSFYLRHVGDPAPSGYSHEYQWGTPALVCDPNNEPVIFEGVVKTEIMEVGKVSMIGLLDKGLLENNKTGYQSGAYAYIYKKSDTEIRIGPSDGNLGGEINSLFGVYTIPNDGILNLSVKIYNGEVSTKVDGDNYISDSYGTIKVLNNTNDNGYYDWDEFEYGAIPGWDNWGTEKMPYTFTVTGCQEIIQPSPASCPTSGAIWTTDSTCTVVNQNIYSQKSEVYLNGGPQTPGGQGPKLPDGSYYVRITDPNGNTVLGQSLYPNVVVANGFLSQCYQLQNIVSYEDNGFFVQGFKDTPNTGGVYKVWFSPDPNFPQNCSKTDNFKIIGEETEPFCGDNIKDPEEECDGEDLGEANPESNFCTTNCKLVPIYNGENKCPPGTVRGKNPIDSTTVSSTNLNGEVLSSLTAGGKYLFEASGTFRPTDPKWHKDPWADAGYTTLEGWPTLATQYGIKGTGSDYGAHALLADLGEGVGIVEWGNFNENHVYTKYYEPTTNQVQFLIGDRYGSWFNTSWDNQAGMNDNEGSLNLDVYECVPEKPQYLCNDTIYTANNQSSLAWLDSSNGNTHDLTTMNFGSSASADDPLNYRTYYINRYGNKDELAYYDHDSDTHIAIDNLNVSSFFTKLAFDIYGNLYGLNDNHSLYLIDKENASVEKKGIISEISTGGDIIFDENNDLYLIDTNGKFYTIDLSNLSASLVKNTELSTVTGIAYRQGVFYVSTINSGKSNIYTMDKAGNVSGPLNQEPINPINDLSSCLPGIPPACGDGVINQKDEQCDGTDGVAIDGSNFCTDTCKLIPVYFGDNDCPEGKVKSAQPIFSQPVKSNPISAEYTIVDGLTEGEDYLIEASEKYQFDPGVPTKWADAAYAAYATNNAGDIPWNLRTDLGIWPTTGKDSVGNYKSRGVTSLISDMGTDIMGVVDWGNFDEDHKYSFLYHALTSSPKFIISEWYGDWYKTSQNNNNTWNNTGNLTLDVYKCVEPGLIQGTKYLDENANGVHNYNLSLTPYENQLLNDWTIRLYDENWELIDETITADLGNKGQYRFDVAPGTYNICEKMKGNFTQTGPILGAESINNNHQPTGNGTAVENNSPNKNEEGPVCWQANLQSGETDNWLKFGNIQHGSVEVYKFDDVNGNGVWDKNGDEDLLSDWEIVLGEKTETTDNDGKVIFADLNPGQYDLSEILKEGWGQTNIYCLGDQEEPDNNNIEPTPSPPLEATGVLGLANTVFAQAQENNSHQITVNPGQATTCYIGNFELGQISGYKIYDRNDNDTKEEGEEGIEDWEICLTGDNLETQNCTKTDSNGYYEFTGLTAGTYTVTEEDRSAEGWRASNPESGTYENIEIASGSNVEADFYNAPPANIWLTKNNNTTGSVGVGQTIEYTLTITVGQRTLSEMELRDVLPDGFVYQTGTSTIDGATVEPTITNEGKTLIWNWDEEVPGESVVVVKYTIQIDPTNEPATYTNIAHVYGYGSPTLVESSIVDSSVKIDPEYQVEGRTVGGQVLGAATEGKVLGAATLPATGANTWYSIVALILIAGGITLRVKTKKFEDN